jgi:cytoskeletal protein CcmA (bactofilin family)
MKMWRKNKKRKSTKIDSLVGGNSVLTGDVKFSGGMHVDGTIKGTVHSEGGGYSCLTVSERGTIEGEVQVECVLLSGLVKGDVRASEQIALASSARVEGDVYYGLMEMAIGAEVNGKLVRITDEERPSLSLDYGGVPQESD